MTTVRSAHTEDLPELCKLFDAYRLFYRMDSAVEDALNFLSERLRQNDSVIFVAETADGKLAGFTQLYPLFSSTRMKRLWLLNDLYVTETQRGKGVSKLLLAAAQQLAMDTGACGLLLETEKTNHIGNALYPSMQFELQTSTHFYFWTNANTSHH